MSSAALGGALPQPLVEAEAIAEAARARRSRCVDWTPSIRASHDASA